MTKLEKLRSILLSYESVLIAFSGGVDSTFLLKAAHDVLGRSKVMAVTAKSETYPKKELEASKELAKLIDAKHLILETTELGISGFKENSPERCYYCKQELFSKLGAVANSEGLKVVCDGSTADDREDYRPGTRAARELGIRSPLDEADFTKEDIRGFSREMNLPSWDKPSFACLASRFPYGEEITPQKLNLIDKGESILRKFGFRQFRLRYHGNIARIEAAKGEMALFSEPNVREEVSRALKSLGFNYITLDLEGYRTGSMNEVLRWT